MLCLSAKGLPNSVLSSSVQEVSMVALIRCWWDRLTVDVVGLGLSGVAEEQRLGKSLGGGDLDGRSSSADVLRESLSGLDSGQGAGGTSAVGEGLDVDGAGTVVDDNGLVGGGSSAEDGSESSEGAELHDGGLVRLGLSEVKSRG